ncbi:hypothetical protein QVZ41_14475 [Wenyingzhuangia sp. chi5]|uniref:Uncharacterized protein n=1 Tax=Wenyingzhuangia gilva TaxID=3057677 RepID=A0ABT8VVT8_9FLAO|nr:hypothetical protein [Wenyingzhuangia sp. chi5]MDO3696055.1 hypothetical protein [Wenyingzhuangia sp. chi5]
MDKRWEENIYYMIKCFSDYDRQKRVWLGQDNNHTSSFDEDISLLFDSYCFEDFILELKKDEKNKCPVDELVVFEKMLDTYESKFSDKEILEDFKWVEIVNQAKEVIKKWNQ